MNPLFFTFEQAAALQVETDWPLARDFFAGEYAFHADNAPKTSLPALQVRIENRPRPGWTAHRHKALATWQYAIQLQQTAVQISACSNSWALPMIHHMLIHPSLRWLAAGQGTLLLHAGGVVKNGKSILLTGEGGAGKTTTTSLALASGGWQIHADDYVFLRPGEGSRAYVTRSHLYLSLLRWVPEAANRLTLWERLKLEFFGRARAWSGERLKWPVRLPLQRLWPQAPIAPLARPAALVLLQRGLPRESQRGEQARLTSLENRQEAVESLLRMNFGEARHFIHLLKKSGAFSTSWLEDWQSQERHLLRQLCQEIPLYQLELPPAKTAQTARDAILPALERLSE